MTLAEKDLELGSNSIRGKDVKMAVAVQVQQIYVIPCKGLDGYSGNKTTGIIPNYRVDNGVLPVEQRQIRLTIAVDVSNHETTPKKRINVYICGLERRLNYRLERSISVPNQDRDNYRDLAAACDAETCHYNVWLPVTCYVPNRECATHTHRQADILPMNEGSVSLPH